MVEVEDMMEGKEKQWLDGSFRFDALHQYVPRGVHSTHDCWFWLGSLCKADEGKTEKTEAKFCMQALPVHGVACPLAEYV